MVITSTRGNNWIYFSIDTYSYPLCADLTNILMSHRRRAPRALAREIPPLQAQVIPSLDFSCLQSNQTCSSPPLLKRDGGGMGNGRGNQYESLVQRKVRLDAVKVTDSDARLVGGREQSGDHVRHMKAPARRKVPRELEPINRPRLKHEEGNYLVSNDAPSLLDRNSRVVHKLPSLSKSDGHRIMDGKMNMANALMMANEQSYQLPAPRKGGNLQPIQNARRQQPGRMALTRLW